MLLKAFRVPEELLIQVRPKMFRYACPFKKDHDVALSWAYRWNCFNEQLEKIRRKVECLKIVQDYSNYLRSHLLGRIRRMDFHQLLAAFSSAYALLIIVIRSSAIFLNSGAR